MPIPASWAASAARRNMATATNSTLEGVWPTATVGVTSTDGGVSSLANLCARVVGSTLSLYREEDGFGSIFAMLPPAIISCVSRAASGQARNSNVALLCANQYVSHLLVSSDMCPASLSSETLARHLLPRLLGSDDDDGGCSGTTADSNDSDCGWETTQPRSTGLFRLRSLALENCPGIRADLIRRLGLQLPGLTSLSLAGSCNEPLEGGIAIGEICKLRALRSFDVRRNHWFGSALLEQVLGALAYPKLSLRRLACGNTSVTESDRLASASYHPGVELEP